MRGFLNFCGDGYFTKDSYEVLGRLNLRTCIGAEKMLMLHISMSNV